VLTFVPVCWIFCKCKHYLLSSPLRNRYRCVVLVGLLSSFGLVASVKADNHQESKPLAWQPCPSGVPAKLGFECTRLSRPLRNNQSDGPQIELAVYRLPASGSADQRLGSLFFNPGGPGQPGGTSANNAFLIPQELRKAFDFVTWDPRGLGASSPSLTGCSVGPVQRPATGPVDWQQVLDQRRKELGDANRACIESNRDLITAMGTVETAHDLDALRAALGDSKLSYWGVSYGTVIGSTYAALYPDKVRALVLDGSVDPWIDLFGLSDSSVAPDDASRFFLALYPDLAPKLTRVLDRLTLRPITLKNGSDYTRWDLLDPLQNFVTLPDMISGPFARTLIETVDHALFGTPTEQSAAMDQLEHPLLRSPEIDKNAAAGFAAVICQDFPQRPSIKLQQQQLERVLSQAPVFGGSLGANFLALCSGYDNVPAQDPVPRAPFPNVRVPGLVVGSSWDGSTPWVWSMAMARAFPSMRTVQSVGSQHGTVIGVQSDCVRSAVSEYLLSAKVPSLDVACPYKAPKVEQDFQ